MPIVTCDTAVLRLIRRALDGYQVCIRCVSGMYQVCIRYVSGMYQVCIRSVSGLDQAWVNRRISDMSSGDIVRIQSFAWCGMAASSRTEADWRLVFLDPCETARYQSHDHTDREKKH